MLLRFNVFEYLILRMVQRLLFAWVVILGIPAMVLGQDEEPRYHVNGKIFSVDSVSPLSNAFVIIKSNDGGAISDGSGRFSVYARKTDTLLISFTGLMPQTIPVGNLVGKSAPENMELFLKVYMRPLVIRLRSAVVTAIRPASSKTTDQQFFEGQIKRFVVKPSVAMNQGIVVTGALSALIAPFTHKGKEMIKFEQMYLRMETERVVNQRFNEDLVHQLTGMAYEDIPAFKKFCGFSNEFVLGSDDYSFLFAIKQAYNRYLYSRFGREESR